jgi:hypothetical protein
MGISKRRSEPLQLTPNTLKKKVLYGTSKKGSVDVEKLPNLSKVLKKE